MKKNLPFEKRWNIFRVLDIQYLLWIIWIIVFRFYPCKKWKFCCVGRYFIKMFTLFSLIYYFSLSTTYKVMGQKLLNILKCWYSLVLDQFSIILMTNLWVFPPWASCDTQIFKDEEEVILPIVKTPQIEMMEILWTHAKTTPSDVGMLTRASLILLKWHTWYQSINCNGVSSQGKHYVTTTISGGSCFRQKADWPRVILLPSVLRELRTRTSWIQLQLVHK